MQKPKDIFLKSTFWDANFDNFDFNTDKYFIISRVLTRGTDKEINFVLSYYTQSDILDALNNSKGIDKKTLNFVEIGKKYTV